VPGGKRACGGKSQGYEAPETHAGFRSGAPGIRKEYTEPCNAFHKERTVFKERKKEYGKHYTWV
jgi:hypothetical protein